MGYEIVYCGGCQRQLRGPEFEQGAAFRLKNQAFCKACAPKAVRTLPPDLMQQLLEQIARSEKKAAKPARAGRTVRRRFPSALVGGGLAAAALAVVLLRVLGLSGPAPETASARPASAAKAGPPPPAPAPVPPKPPVALEPASVRPPPPAPKAEPLILEFVAAADVVLDEKQAVTPLGRSPYLGCEEEEDQRRHSFLRFQLSGLPAGATVLEAELRLHCTSGSDSGGLIRYFLPDDPVWDESKPTWSAPLKGRDLSDDLSGVGAVEPGKPAVWTGLAHPLLKNGPLTLVLRSKSPKGCAYRSREWTLPQERPLLRLKVTRS